MHAAQFAARLAIFLILAAVISVELVVFTSGEETCAAAPSADSNGVCRASSVADTQGSPIQSAVDAQGTFENFLDAKNENPSIDDLDELETLLTAAKTAVTSLTSAITRYEEKVKRLRNAHSSEATEGQPDVALSRPAAVPGSQPIKIAENQQHESQLPAVSSKAVASEEVFDAVVVGGGGQLASYQGWQRIVAKGRKAWSNYFSLVAAVMVDNDVTAVHPMHENSFNGQYRFMVLGDKSGKLYFFSPQGETLLEHYTGTSSPVTAITGFPLSSTQSQVVTGHEDGEVRHHLMGERYDRISDLFHIVNITLESVTPHPYNTSDYGGAREGSPSVMFLDFHRNQMGKTTVAVDRWGSHRWIFSNGEVRFTTHSNATILAARKGKTLTAMAVEDGMWVNVAPPYEHVMRKLECVPLNGSVFVAAAFDVLRPYLLYAVTNDGQLLTLLAPTDNRADNCTIWSARPLALPPGDFQLTAIKGYLVLFHQLGVAVFNVTAAGRSAPTDVVMEAVSRIATFGRSIASVDRPLVGGCKVQHLALHFGGGLVGIFSNTLPVYSPPDLKLDVWTKPLFVVIMVVVAVWQFQRGSSSPSRERFSMRGGMGGPGDQQRLEAILRRVQAEEHRRPAAADSTSTRRRTGE